jgi:hypothetical protein
VRKTDRTLTRILRGTSDANIRFDDLRLVLRTLGFAERVRGDHHIFTRKDIVEILNLQPRGAKAKAYQVRQVRTLIVEYELAGSSEEETDEKKDDE